MTTLPLRKSIGRSACRRGFILISLTLTCLALLPTAQTIPEPTPPPQAHVEGDLGNGNTVEGNGLSMLTTGTDNTAMGFDALFFNTTGSFNTATGSQALKANNGFGIGNTADGYQALESNTIASGNTAVGNRALADNTTGSSNTAIGARALGGNTTGSGNIALGILAGGGLTTGDNNIDIGTFGAPNDAKTIRIGDPFMQRPPLLRVSLEQSFQVACQLL